MGKTPKIIHQTWKTTDLSDTYRENKEEWIKLHPDYIYSFYTDDDMEKIMEERVSCFLNFFSSLTKKIEKVDFFRYALLYLEGGIYCDMDTIPIKPLDYLVDSDRIVLAYEPIEHMKKILPWKKKRMVCNAIMISPPGESFWSCLMEYISRNYRGDSDPVRTTGPLCLTLFLEEYFAYHERDNRIMLLGCDSFYSSTNGKTDNHQIVKGKRIPYISAECFPLKEGNVYAFHQWSNTWVSKRPDGKILVFAMICTVMGIYCFLNV